MVKRCDGGWLRLAEELVSELHEGRLGQVLGEVVGHFVSCWGVFQLKFRCFDEIPDQMMHRLDVLGPFLGDWTFGQADCSLIVTVDKSRFRDHPRTRDENQQPLREYGFMCCKSESDILSHTKFKCNTSLFLRSPRHHITIPVYLKAKARN